MLALAFDTPWYAWPITGAMVGAIITVIGGFKVAKFAFNGQRTLKLHDCIVEISKSIDTYTRGMGSAVCPIPDIGKAITDEQWEKTALAYSSMLISFELIKLYCDKKTCLIIEDLKSRCTDLWMNVRKNVTIYQHRWDGMTEKDRRIHSEALHYLGSVADTKIPEIKQIRLDLISKCDIWRNSGPLAHLARAFA